MDGLTLIRGLRQVLGEVDDTSWLDLKYTYDCLYDAAIATADATNCLTTTQSITVADSTSSYTLNGNFLKLYVVNVLNQFVIKYNISAGATSLLGFKPYNYIFMANHTTKVAVPSCFSITDSAALTPKTGTTTSAGAKDVSGESTLTDSGAGFLVTNKIKPGDFVHNSTQNSTGIVTVATSATALQTAMFDNDTGQPSDWASGDSYYVDQQGRYQLVIDPPTTGTADTITVPYVYRPDPVYSYYRVYPFPVAYKDPIIAYAAWKYKYRNQEPNFGDGFYQQFEMSVKNLSDSVNLAMNKPGYRTNVTRQSVSRMQQQANTRPSRGRR